MYQLRGRVGRSIELLMRIYVIRKTKFCLKQQKRLKAIKEFTELVPDSNCNEGFRNGGAGNLLGSEQHGHMEAIGYDLYCKLLEETVKEIKGEALRFPLNDHRAEYQCIYSGNIYSE